MALGVGIQLQPATNEATGQSNAPKLLVRYSCVQVSLRECRYRNLV